MAFSLSAAGKIVVEIADDVDPGLAPDLAAAKLGAQVIAQAEAKEKEVIADFAALVHKHRGVFKFASFTGAALKADVIAEADKIKDAGEGILIKVESYVPSYVPTHDHAEAEVADPTNGAGSSPEPAATEPEPAPVEVAPVDPTPTSTEPSADAPSAAPDAPGVPDAEPVVVDPTPVETPTADTVPTDAPSPDAAPAPSADVVEVPAAPILQLPDEPAAVPGLQIGEAAPSVGPTETAAADSQPIITGGTADGLTAEVPAS